MTTSTITQSSKGIGMDAIRNFALAISQGYDFNFALEQGALFCDNTADEDAYAKMIASWKLGALGVEVDKVVIGCDGNIIGWITKNVMPC